MCNHARVCAHIYNYIHADTSYTNISKSIHKHIQTYAVISLGAFLRRVEDAGLQRAALLEAVASPGPHGGQHLNKGASNYLRIVGGRPGEVVTAQLLLAEARAGEDDHTS